MNKNEVTLRRTVTENLRFAEQVGRKVAKIRDLFEERLKENPLYFWNPSLKDFRRQELYGYGRCKLEGEFEFVVLPQDGQYVPSAPEVSHGRYNLILVTEGTSLRDNRIDVSGTVDGYGSIDDYALPPVKDIRGMSRVELENLLLKIDHLETLLKLIGLLSDGEVDPEEM